ncbi:MAG: putative alpha/beta superfamily hydrolase [Phycisphaerales bacterium]|jgi:predicted alpha/beta superfamily hydrolase
MNTPRVTRFFLALLGSCFASMAIAQPAVLRIEAIDRTGTLEEAPQTRLFLGASFNGWNPAGTEQSGWFDENGERVGWVFEIPRSKIEHGGEFKLTRGSWATVECTAQGQPIDNRRTGEPDWDLPGGPVLLLEVLGFEDAFEAAGKAAVSTVVGGTLEVWEFHSEALGEDRTVRVWLPEAYEAQPDRALGVFYFHDGQNVFDTQNSAFGVEWQADEAVSELAGGGVIEPWIIVGVDNSGVNRSRDYLPFAPGSIAPELPGGGADEYLRFLIDELMPEIASRYRVRTGPEHTGLGGSSFGGVITLHAIMSRPGVFGAALVESPSLSVGDGKLMAMLEAFDGAWPERVFLGMGDAETGRADRDAQLVEACQRAGAMLRTRGLGTDRLRVVIGEGARHNEAAWQERLPGALGFLLGKDQAAGD